MQSDEPNDRIETKLGEYASPDEILHHELGEELYKKTVPFLNDVLSKLLTISITLSGGTVFFLGDKGYPGGMRIAAIVLFLLAFIMSLVGMLPYRVSLSYCCPEEVKETVRLATAWKDGFLCGAAAFIVLGVAVATTGFFLGAPAGQ